MRCARAKGLDSPEKLGSVWTRTTGHFLQHLYRELVASFPSCRRLSDQRRWQEIGSYEGGTVRKVVFCRNTGDTYALITTFFGSHAPDAHTAWWSVVVPYFKRLETCPTLATSSYDGVTPT